MLPRLRAFLLENWSHLPFGGRPPHHLSFVLQGTGVRKVCAYVVPDDATEPRWVAKIARTPDDNGAMEREYALVRHLREHGSAFVRDTVPGPLFTTSLGGLVVALEPYVRGQPMDASLVGAPTSTGPATRRCLDLAVGWLLRAQTQTPPQGGRLTDEQVRTHFLRPLARLRATARLTDAELAFLDRLDDRVLELADRSLPLVFNHGDFQPKNLLIDGERLRVIDWEFGERSALPLLDVFGILARTQARWHGIEEIDGYLEDYLAAFRDVFCEGGSFAGLTAEYVARACCALDLDPAWVGVLFAMFLVIEANRYHEFLSQRAERGYVYLMRRRGTIGCSYADQLARQKHVWLLGELARSSSAPLFPSTPLQQLVNPPLTVAV